MSTSSPPLLAHFHHHLYMLKLLSCLSARKQTNKTLSPGQNSISFLPNQIAFISSFHFLLKSGSVLCPHLYHHWSTKITLSIFPPKLYCLLYNEIQWTILRSYLQGLWASLDSVDYFLLLEALSRLCNWLFSLLLLLHLLKVVLSCPSRAGTLFLLYSDVIYSCWLLFHINDCQIYIPLVQNFLWGEHTATG